MYSKGGLVGLIFDDFNERERSGNWTLSDNSEDLNYIRSNDIPNNYLLVGTYSDQSLYLYNMYYKNKISTNIFNHIGSITSIDYHFKKNLLAIGITKPPYLRIYNTEDFSEIIPLFSLTDSPVSTLKFSGSGEKLYVGLLNHVNGTYVLEFETSMFDLVSDLPPIFFIPTKIACHNNDEYLAIGHYSTKDFINNNIIIFNNEYIEQTTNILNKLNISTVLDLVFIESYNLLVIATNNSPHLIFYSYISQNTFDNYNSEIEKYVKSRVTSICKTSDNQSIIFGCESNPFLMKLDFSTGKITLLDSEYFTNSITNVTLSINDEFLCVTQRGENSLLVFDFSKKDLSIPIKFTIKPTSTCFASKFFIGPVIQVVNILKPTCSISSDDLGVIAIDHNYNPQFTGTFYINNNTTTQYPDLTPLQNIFQVSIYKSLDYNSVITGIKLDGSLVSTDLLTNNSKINNIVQISSYYTRVAFLDFYNTIIILPNNNFSISELNVIKLLRNTIKQISVGYRTLLALTFDGEVISSNINQFNPEEYLLPEIIQVSAGYNHVSLLTIDNTVLSYGLNDYGECNTSSWSNVKQISVGDFHTAALTYDNKVLVTGPFTEQIKSEIELKQDIVYISSGPTCLILLNKDKTLSFYTHTLSQTSSNIDVSSLINIGTFDNY